jgi:hypothetical protein
MARAKADAAAIYKAEYAAALKEIREEARLAATREAAATKK